MSDNVKDVNGGETKLVYLNFGGKRFVTTLATLTRGSGESFFTPLLRGTIPSTQDQQGYYFIDRNGKAFEPILDFLRTGILSIPSHISRKLVEELASFLMIDIGDVEPSVSQEELLQYVNAIGPNGLQLPCYNLEKLTFDRLTLTASNFAGSTLRGSSFVRAYLSTTNFQDADISKVNFSHAKMEHANLINAKCEYTDFSHTCLDYASLRNANLSYSNFSNCTIASASLSGAVMTGANIIDLQLTSLYCKTCHHNVVPSEKVMCPVCVEPTEVVVLQL